MTEPNTNRTWRSRRPSDPTEPAAAALRAFRTRHGLSLAVTARLIGRPVRRTAEYLAGARRPSARAAQTINRLIAELDANPSLIGAPKGKPGRPPRSRNMTDCSNP